MKEISAQALNKLVEQWNDNSRSIPKSSWYAYNDQVWIGLDNTTGDCYVKQFDRKKDAIRWLKDND